MAMQYAMLYKNPSFLRKLLSLKQIDIDTYLVTREPGEPAVCLMRRAISDKWLAGVEILLDHGARLDYVLPIRPDSSSEASVTPLFLAACLQRVDIVRLLISKGAKVDVRVDGYTELILAAKNGNIELAALLLEAGANPNVVCPETHQSLVQMALQSSRTAAFLPLLAEYGADVGAIDRDRRFRADRVLAMPISIYRIDSGRVSASGTS
jgi:hypothetical protein